ncbi:MAG: phosphotransferase, partial [Anaerolineae bacterium]
PLISPVIHGDLNTSNILVGLDDDLPVWLIDFSDARPGHIYFDLAKLEVEVRTHVLFWIFRQMVADGVWSVEDAFRFALLLESMLLQAHKLNFDSFLKKLGESQPEWYDALSTQFPYYSENLLYFLYSIRRLASTHSPDRFENHYATAVFFHSMAALKYQELDNQPWQPWAKRLALCAALVAGKHAVATVTRPYRVGRVLESLRQRSAFAIIAIGEGSERKYLLQWNDNWGMFNLIGGKMDDEKGDRRSFARTIQRELVEELEIYNARDYRITHEYPPLITHQFSRRQMVNKEYEFRVYEIAFLPRHPMTREEYEWLAQRLSPERENVLVSRAEIKRLRTMNNRPISETTRMILQELGEIDRFQEEDLYATLGIKVDTRKLAVQHGRAQLTGRLINPPFGAPVENILLEILPADGVTPEVDSAGIRVEKLAVGEAYPLSIWLRPEAEQTKITIRATYYDQRGHRYQQNLEGAFMFLPELDRPTQFDSPYVVGKPLTAAQETLFVGRDDVFHWLEMHLLGKAQPHSLTLYGQKHMGKTSVFQQFVYGRRGQAVRSYEEYPIFLVYVNLMGAAQWDTQSLFDHIRRQVVQTLHERGIVLPLSPANDVQGTIYSDFDDFLDQVEMALPSLSLLVLALDEMEQLRHGM